MCAPNGARRTKADHAVLPITPNELADCAESVLAAGAAIMHVHVRDDALGHSLDVARYRQATDAIRDRVGDRLVIQITTEACGKYRRSEQMAMVQELRPEAVSLAIRELCPDNDAEPAARDFFCWLKTAGVMTQYILYSQEEAAYFAYLLSIGVIPDESPFALLVLGQYNNRRDGNASDLDPLAAAMGAKTEWAVCCFGQAEQDAVARASALNGHARVGFENNILLPDGNTAFDNAALVRLAAKCRGDRPLATAACVRQMFL